MRPARRRRSRLAVVIALTAGLAAACSRGAGTGAGKTATTPASTASTLTTTTGSRPPGATTTGALTGNITVFADSVLSFAMDGMGRAFSLNHPGTGVSFTYGSSDALVNQIVGGAVADVFVSSDADPIGRLAQDGELASEPVVFARGRLAIVVPKGNPDKITSLSVLAGINGLVVAACDIETPCGAWTDAVLTRAGVALSPAAREPDGPSVVFLVATGKAQAGLAPLNQAAGAAQVETVPIPDDEGVLARYPAAPLAGSNNAAVAAAFVRFLLSPAGQSVIAESGLQPVAPLG